MYLHWNILDKIGDYSSPFIRRSYFQHFQILYPLIHNSPSSMSSSVMVGRFIHLLTDWSKLWGSFSTPSAGIINYQHILGIFASHLFLGYNVNLLLLVSTGILHQTLWLLYQYTTATFSSHTLNITCKFFLPHYSLLHSKLPKVSEYRSFLVKFLSFCTIMFFYKKASSFKGGHSELFRKQEESYENVIQCLFLRMHSTRRGTVGQTGRRICQMLVSCL